MKTIYTAAFASLILLTISPKGVAGATGDCVLTLQCERANLCRPMYARAGSGSTTSSKVQSSESCGQSAGDTVMACGGQAALHATPEQNCPQATTSPGE